MRRLGEKAGRISVKVFAVFLVMILFSSGIPAFAEQAFYTYQPDGGGGGGEIILYGDGPVIDGAETGIQALIDALPSEGGTVFIPAGLYNLDNFIHIDRDNVTLMGETGTILRMNDGANHPVIVLGHLTDPHGNRRANIRIENLDLDGNRIGQTQENDSINPGIMNQCIEARGIDDLWIKGVEAHAARSGGIVLGYACERVFINDCTIYDNYFDGISVNGCNNVLVTDFVAYDNLSAGVTMDAGNTNIQYANGLIYDNGTVGIFCRWAEDITFRGLDVYSNAQHGMFVSYDDAKTFDTGVDGMYIEGCSFRDNVLNGFYFNPEPDGTTNYSSNNYLSGCSFEGNGGEPVVVDDADELIRSVNMYGTGSNPIDNVVYEGIRLRNWGDKILWGNAGNDQYLTENFGVEIHGSGTNPVQIIDTSLLVGYDQTSGSFRGVGNLFVSGDLGVGKLGANAKLDVNGTLRAVAYRDSSGEALIYSSDNSVIVNEDGDGSLNLTANVSSPLWSSSNTGGIYYNEGNVGIGTTTPASKLDVSGGSVTIDNAQYYECRDASGVARDILGMVADNSVAIGNSFATTGLRFYTQDGEKMSLNQSGQLGIGTTTPTKKLDVDGDINFSGDLYKDGELFTAGSLWTENNDGSIYYTAGNIGIGTTTPAYTLDVVDTANPNSKMFFDEVTGSLRVGYRQDASWNIDRGNYSVAIGADSKASGWGSVALGGQYNQATGYGSVALGGINNHSTGNYSICLGLNNWSEGNTSIAIGNNARAVGYCSIAMGRQTVAEADRTVVIGYGGEYNPYYGIDNRIINNIPDSLMIGFGGPDSTMFVDGSNVGIGTITPADKLEVAGNIRFNDWGNKLQWVDAWANQYITEGWGIELFGTAISPIQVRDTSLMVGYDQTDTTDRGIGNLYVSGNTGIGTSSPGYKLEVAGAVMLENSSAPLVTTGHAGLFADGGELYSVDEMGNSTQISPHDKETGEWIFYSKNVKTGRVLRINMEKLVKKMEDLTGEKFSEEWVE